MKKKIISVLLVVTLSIAWCVPSFAAQQPAKRTLEDAVNKMTLSPTKTKNWPQEYKDMILNGLEGKTNYQKMKAIYHA